MTKITFKDVPELTAFIDAVFIPRGSGQRLYEDIEFVNVSSAQAEILKEKSSGALEGHDMDFFMKSYVLSHVISDSVGKLSGNLKIFSEDENMKALLIDDCARTIAATKINVNNALVAIGIPSSSGILIERDSLSQAFENSAIPALKNSLHFVKEDFLPAFQDFIAQNFDMEPSEVKSKIAYFEDLIASDPKSSELFGIGFFAPIDPEKWNKAGGVDRSLDNDFV